MWKRKRTWLLLLALIAAALAVYFEPTRCVRGWLHGEAFFDGRARQGDERCASIRGTDGLQCA